MAQRRDPKARPKEQPSAHPKAPDWRAEREAMRERVAQLAAAGKCYQCEDLAGGAVFGQQPLIYEDDGVRVVLDRFPRARGHTLVIAKAHHDDLSSMSPDAAAGLFLAARRVSRAIKGSLKAQRVYVAMIVDGPGNHVHLQLVPRYENDQPGASRLVAPRQPLTNGAAVAAAIRDALEA